MRPCLQGKDAQVFHKVGYAAQESTWSPMRTGKIHRSEC